MNTVSAQGRAILGFSQHFSRCFPALISPQSELIQTTQRSFICHFSHLNLFIPNFCRRSRVGIITQKPSYIPRGQHILPAVYCLLQLLDPVLCGTFHMLTRRLEQLCGGLRGWDDHLDEVVVTHLREAWGPFVTSQSSLWL